MRPPPAACRSDDRFGSACVARTSVSFTYDRYGHLSPEVDSGEAAKLDAVRTRGLGMVEGRS
jgi:hypothetical protein